MKSGTVMTPSDLQPHYGNGVFDNVYLSALDNILRGKHCQSPIALMGVVYHLGPNLLRYKNTKFLHFHVHQTKIVQVEIYISGN
jgi:hypothetical protein